MARPWNHACMLWDAVLVDPEQWSEDPNTVGTKPTPNPTQWNWHSTGLDFEAFIAEFGPLLPLYIAHVRPGTTQERCRRGRQALRIPVIAIHTSIPSNALCRAAPVHPAAFWIGVYTVTFM